MHACIHVYVRLQSFKLLREIYRYKESFDTSSRFKNIDKSHVILFGKLNAKIVISSRLYIKKNNIFILGNRNY